MPIPTGFSVQSVVVKHVSESGTQSKGLWFYDVRNKNLYSRVYSELKVDVGDQENLPCHTNDTCQAKQQ